MNVNFHIMHSLTIYYFETCIISSPVFRPCDSAFNLTLPSVPVGRIIARALPLYVEITGLFTLAISFGLAFEVVHRS